MTPTGVIAESKFTTGVTQHYFSRKKNSAGFTLIELLVVIAIIGILATIVLASLNTGKNRGVDAAIKSNMATIIKETSIFYIDNTSSNYNEVCGINGATQIPIVAQAITELQNIAGPTNEDVMCHAPGSGNASAWAVSVKLKNGGFWCIDSIGAIEEIPGRVAVSPETKLSCSAIST